MGLFDIFKPQPKENTVQHDEGMAVRSTLSEEEQLTHVLCLDCNQKIHAGDQPEVGNVLVCENCGSEMEIIDVEPLEVDYLYVMK